MSPVASAMPLFIASYIPESGSDTKQSILCLYLPIIWMVLSVEPPSIIIYWMLSNVCLITDSRQRSMVFWALYATVISEIFKSCISGKIHLLIYTKYVILKLLRNLNKYAV